LEGTENFENSDDLCDLLWETKTKGDNQVKTLTIEFKLQAQAIKTFDIV